ncbi:YybH family protein [Microtetraspora glauca]|uniref:Nuclear transport factor 2 family protein n=1 Tax=Microtetraspora glauca TaxID=1996 RepID=A0ABV3GNV5_MICGL
MTTMPGSALNVMLLDDLEVGPHAHVLMFGVVAVEEPVRPETFLTLTGPLAAYKRAAAVADHRGRLRGRYGGRGPDIPDSCVVVLVAAKIPHRLKGWVPMPTQREEDEARIRQQVDKIVEGIRAKDLEGLKQLYATDVVSFDVEPPLQHVGIAAKLKNWAKAFTFFQDVNYEVRDLTVTVGDEVAFGHAFGRLSGTLKNGTATSGMWVRGTFCFRKLDGDWLIAHDQVSVPFDIASGKGVADLEP